MNGYKILGPQESNKKGILISIVGFGRPKFGSSPAAKPAVKSNKIDASIQNAIDLLKSKGYKVTK